MATGMAAMIRRYLARRKMRWAVRWIRRHRYPGYQMRVGRLYGKRVAIYSKPNGVAEGIISPEAIALVRGVAQMDVDLGAMTSGWEMYEAMQEEPDDD